MIPVIVINRRLGNTALVVNSHVYTMAGSNHIVAKIPVRISRLYLNLNG